MASTVTHKKVNTVASWTQSQLDAAIAAGQFAPGTTIADITLSGDWNEEHNVVIDIADVAAPGSNTQIIYNNSGTFGASADNTWNNTSKVLTVNGVIELNQATTSALIIGDTSGNARGSQAVDIQSTRQNATQVAGGSNSVAIGLRNTASASCQAIGALNSVGSQFSSASGYINSVSGMGLTCAGYQNIMTGGYSTNVGASGTVSAYYSTNVGYLNIINGAAGGYTQEATAIGTSLIIVASQATVIGTGFSLREDGAARIGDSTGQITIQSAGKLGTANVKNPTIGLQSGSNILSMDLSSLGAEKVTNGTFTGSATGWTLGTGWAYNLNNVQKNANGTGTLSQTIGAVAGEWYQVSFTLSGGGSTLGTLSCSLGGATAPTINLFSMGVTTFTFQLLATTTGDLIFTPSNTSRVTIDNVSVKKITSGDITALGDMKIPTLGKSLAMASGTGGYVGQVALIAGVATITITGLTANDFAFTQLVTPGGTIGAEHKAVCTANTLTITGISLAGATQALDTSTLNYFIVKKL